MVNKEVVQIALRLIEPTHVDSFSNPISYGSYNFHARLAWCTRLFYLNTTFVRRARLMRSPTLGLISFEVHGQSVLFIPQCHLNGALNDPTFHGRFNESIQMSFGCSLRCTFAFFLLLCSFLTTLITNQHDETIRG